MASPPAAAHIVVAAGWRFFYLVATVGKAGLMLPIRTFPVSPAVAGARTGGNAGLMLPIRTFPVSRVVAGSRTGGNAGLMLPILIFPLSETTAGVSSPWVPFMEGSVCSAERNCSDLHVLRDLLAAIKNKRICWGNRS
jgi:hypothetical protein